MSGRSAKGLWQDHLLSWHINRLEIMAVFRSLSLKHFLPDLRGHHVLVCTDNTSVVSYIIQEQTSCRGRGRGPGNGDSTPRWWNSYEKLWSSRSRPLCILENTHCPLWFSLSQPAPLGLDAMMQTWPRSRLYAFPPISLLQGVLERVRRDGALLLLLAPCWQARVWFSDRESLLDGSPLEIPLGGTFSLSRAG
jgi:hypothetical protein